jgi:hypothetical protein
VLQARNSIWEEHVKKENRTLKLGETFAISDPRKSERRVCQQHVTDIAPTLFCLAPAVDILPEKPNRTVPAQNPDPATVAAAQALLHVGAACFPARLP